MFPNLRNRAAPIVVVGGLALATLILGQTASRPAAKDTPLPQRRVAAARFAYEQSVVEPPKTGMARASAEDTYLWSRRWMEAEQDAAVDRPAALAAAEAHRARMTELAGRVKAMREAGQASAAELACAEFYQIDAAWAAQKYRAN